MDISENITMIDDAFSSYLLKHDTNVLCQDVSNILSAFSKTKRYAVNIVNTNRFSKEPFFGMRVFPSEGYIDSVCEKMNVKHAEDLSFKNLLDIWRKIDEWIIEIDSRVFDRMAINFNPEELTAMLLHEVGHTVYSDRRVEMFYRAYMACRIQMKASQKGSAKILYFLYTIPLAMACGMRCWKVTSQDLKEEIFADQSVEKLGYGEHLCSAYRKIIKAYGSGYPDEQRMEDATAQSIFWANTNISDLAHRKNKLKDELYETGSKTDSTFIRNLIKKIMKKLSIHSKERYTGNVVMESAFEPDFDDPQEYVQHNTLIYDFKKITALENRIASIVNSANNAIANEAFGRSKKNEIPNQLDVDTIFVEVDRIQNHADRRYVLDLIYHQEEKINHFLELCEVNQDLKKKHKAKMESMLRELESMRQAVLAKRSFDKQYKVFVKYPSGYEG